MIPYLFREYNVKHIKFFHERIVNFFYFKTRCKIKIFFFLCFCLFSFPHFTIINKLLFVYSTFFSFSHMDLILIK